MTFQVMAPISAPKITALSTKSGVDYSDYRNQPWEGPRYAVVSQLLSITHNWRLRVKVFAPDDDLPAVASVTELWTSANWFEREAFDLFGIIFEGHTDLRRILTDYGFIGHPMRKDFPVTGHVEMRYDAEKRRVIYQPVSIEPREVVPRVVLVGEAVLAGNVPDITAELRREVYAKVRMPRAAAADAGDVMGAMRAAMATPQSMAQVPAGNPLHAPGN